MNADREAISVALFTLLQNAFAWNRSSRHPKIWGDISPADQPAMFLFKIGETATQRRNIALPVWLIEYWCLVYLRVDPNPSDTNIPETTINAILKAIDTNLPPVPKGEKQTLGGLVNNAWWEGKAIIDPGILDQQCAIVIPIHVETGL